MGPMTGGIHPTGFSHVGRTLSGYHPDCRQTIDFPRPPNLFCRVDAVAEVEVFAAADAIRGAEDEADLGVRQA